MGMLWLFLNCGKVWFYPSSLSRGYGKATSYSCCAFSPLILKNCYSLHLLVFSLIVEKTKAHDLHSLK